MQLLSQQSLIVLPSIRPRAVRTPGGQLLSVPEGWVLLAPGDAALTRRVKAAGPTWTVQEKKGRKVFSRGVWAPGEIVEAVRVELARERSTPQYARRRERETQRRQGQQGQYVDDFRAAVLGYLSFDPAHADLARRIADAVSSHATPVGSGTVARTRRIPIEDRAAAAVIAWMRHQTTAYDSIAIPRIRGKRREVRRRLAAESRRLLQAYRSPAAPPADCPLRRALAAAT